MATQPVPRPKRGEVVADVHFAGLNPHDCKLATGQLRRHEPKRLPYVPGNEFSGIVRAIGTAVTRFKPGDAVFGMTDGALAECCVSEERLLAPLPPSVSPVASAGVCVVGMTVIQAFTRAGGIQAGQSVLIHAGAGGVGSFAIQYAKRNGAKVITTTSPHNAEFVRTLGADVVIDYHSTDPRDICSDIDIVLDTLGGDTSFASFEIVRPGGQVVSIVPAEITGQVLRELGVPGFVAWLAGLKPSRIARLKRRHHADYHFVFMRPDPTHIEELARLLASGEVKPVTDRIVPFAKVIKAFEYLSLGRAQGKVIVDVKTQ